MTLLFIDGFDHYATADISKKWSSLTGSNSTIAAAGGRRSGGSWVASTLASQQSLTKTFAATASFAIGLALNYSTFPTSNVDAVIALLDAGSVQCDVRINLDGTISVTRNGTALTNGTSVVSIPTGTWFYLEFKVTIADSIGANTCKVRVNGVDVITVATGQDVKSTANATANGIRIGGISNSGNGSRSVDDFYLCNQSGSVNNDFLGDSRIDTLFPTSDGNYSQFTPSTGSTHYVLVDETTPNTSDYNDGAAVNDRDSYGLGNLSNITVQTVHGVQVNAALMKDDAGAKSACTMVRSGSTNADGASAPIGTSQAYVSQIYEEDPAAVAAWTETTVNAMEAGVKVTA